MASGLKELIALSLLAGFAFGLALDRGDLPSWRRSSPPTQMTFVMTLRGKRSTGTRFQRGLRGL